MSPSTSLNDPNHKTPERQSSANKSVRSPRKMVSLSKNDTLLPIVHTAIHLLAAVKVAQVRLVLPALLLIIGEWRLDAATAAFHGKPSE